MASLYEKNSYRGVVERWVDGDTLVLSVDLGFQISIRSKFRLARINAPEVKKYKGITESEKQRGLLLKGELEKKYPAGTPVVVSNPVKGKYHRYVVELWVESPDGTLLNVNDQLLSEGSVVGVAY